ncbi:gamma-tubulin complex component 2-like [Acanthaster planci]|uniref:Gamma-tubulin complex component n=1 Tax=Acanthaster planci TaxID=133434 RepID=A0A8B7XUX6_ACAPL|nr:gamma-tubulin complex component 2-like [Acanthaster planci]XP_022084042.1 gamma-tubulin complex component 2-like [Acanthaster planci]XP_022084044.1 gamma-tubulin complex component 2-like [Acanthaster planci]XP_022084045.1 gamma-tubulin complex component 2-like [Acanthaster planci]
MSEFRVHHQVSELIKILGLPGGAGPELYVDLLLKNRTPYVTTQVSAHSAKRKIAEFTQTPVEFLQKYDELKSKNNRDLDAFVYLLSKLSEDKDTVAVLQQNAVALQMPMDKVVLPASGSKMSEQEVSELRNQLLSVASSGATSQASEVFKKMMREKQSRKNLSLKLPELSSWVLERPNLTGDFVTSPGTSEPAVALGTLPLGVQELAIVQDLLMVMTGTEGKYTLLRPPQDQSLGRTFVVDQSLDISLREVANRILPVCTMYSAVVRFIEDKLSFEYGVVNHALCGAMKTLIKEYSILTAQLEHQFRQGQLPLQRFWFYIQPCKQTMEILASIAQAIDRGASTGGAVLSLLHERTAAMIGDTRAQNLCLFLTQSACAPYFEILEKWIYKGIIKDPYCEFMIEEHEALRKEKLQQEYNDAYWEQHYTICRDRIPVFLEAVADKILRTGKYLNVIRECGRDPKCPHAEEILYTLKERQYVEHIERAYQYASKVLLDHILDDRELMPRLRSIKRYFLLEQGDFFVHLMDITTEEMKKQVDEIIPSRLESLLELALRTSQAKSDTFKDDLRVALLPYDLITQLLRIISIKSRVEKSIIQEIDPTEIHISCLEAFSFDYVVRWPESLILSRKALTRYQILFRHLYYCKHVERILCNLWVLNKAAKQYTLHSSKWYAAAFALRQRMLHLVQNLQYYMMFEVIEPNWQIMETKLKQVSTIDDVLDIHTDFLNMCLKDCMLTDPELLKIVSKLMLVCVTFANCIQRMTETMNVEGEASFRVDTTDAKTKDKDRAESKKYKTATKVASEHVDQLIGSEEFASTIDNFDSNFSTLLVGLLDQLSLFSTTDCEHNMTNIIHRLDFNGFYTEGLERVAAERRSKEYQEEGQDQGASGSSLTSVSSLSSRARSDSAGGSQKPGGKGT